MDSSTSGDILIIIKSYAWFKMTKKTVFHGSRARPEPDTRDRKVRPEPEPDTQARLLSLSPSPIHEYRISDLKFLYYQKITTFT